MTLSISQLQGEGIHRVALLLPGKGSSTFAVPSNNSSNCLGSNKCSGQGRVSVVMSEELGTKPSMKLGPRLATPRLVGTAAEGTGGAGVGTVSAGWGPGVAEAVSAHATVGTSGEVGAEVAAGRPVWKTGPCWW